MVKLSNSPYEATVLTLEARKSFSLRIELHDRHGNAMSWDDLSATFTLGTLDPLEALLEIPATDGVFRIQASELNLKPRTYQFTITLRSRGYSFVIVKGDVKLVQNTEVGSVDDTYYASLPSETIAVQLDQMNVLKVSLRNTPLLLGESGWGGFMWDTLGGKPSAFPPAQHAHDQQDVDGLVQALEGLTTSLEGKAAASHTHEMSSIAGLESELAGKQPFGSYAASAHSHGIADVSGLQTALNGKAATSHTHTWSQVTSKPTTFPPSTHLHNQFARGANIPAAANLNNYTTPGHYVQPADGNASGGTNYPIGNAGLLEVFASPDDVIIWQRYTSYVPADQRTWVRSRYDGAWGSWASIGGHAVGGWNSVTPMAEISGTVQWRLFRDHVYLAGQVWRSGGFPSGYTTLATLPVDARPARNISFPVAADLAFNGFFRVGTNGTFEIYTYGVNVSWPPIDHIMYPKWF